MSIGLVLVAHSVRLADGVAELAQQMAPDVVVQCAAGDVDGGLGTSLDRVQDALRAALAVTDGVVVLADLGSAALMVESAFELDPPPPARARFVRAPFVEGAVAAAVTAQQGAGIDAVAKAAESAVLSIGPEPAGPPPSGGPDEVSMTVTIPNPLGLHARPAAVVARAVADLGVPVTVDDADATSVLALMSLGTTAGDVVTVAARGARAEAAVAAVVGLVQGGFGEA